MKKFILLVASVLCVATAANAQSFNAGDKNITATVGLGGGYGTPISVSYEQGVTEFAEGWVLGVGGYVGYAGYSEKFAYGKYTYSNLFIAAEGNVHYTQILDKLDLYGGIRLGYNVASADVSFNDIDSKDLGLKPESRGGIIYTAHIGANYYLSDAFAVNLEAGYGLASLSLGVTYKF